MPKTNKKPAAKNKKTKGKPLNGKQYKLDKNKNGKLDKQDFKMMRNKGKKPAAKKKKKK